METPTAALSYYTQPFFHLSEEAKDKFQGLIERATTDEVLRQRLLDAPKETLIDEFGVENINPNASFNVVDGGEAEVTLILPKAMDDVGELDEADLEAVAGGSCTSFSDWTSFGCCFPAGEEG